MQQREGTIKGEHNRASGVWLLLLLLSGCFDTSIWVFTKPQTLYFGCPVPLKWEAYPGCRVLFILPISMCPDLYGGL